MVTWGLTPTTQRVAEWVLARWPQLRITSGRRSLDEQIRVMTRNTRRYGRDWIQQTYRATPLVRRIVDAVVGAINVLRAGHARLACEVSGAVMPPAAGTHRSDSGAAQCRA
jgi:hypothetical protein